MTKNDRKHRHQVLHGAMDKKGLEIRDDSVYCHDYIHGVVDVDLDEIVGIQYITGELFDSGGSQTCFVVEVLLDDIALGISMRTDRSKCSGVVSRRAPHGLG